MNTKTDAERTLAAQQLDTLRALAQTMTSWAARWSGRITNNVLEVSTWTLDASGAKGFSWGAAAGSVRVRNLSTHPMTVSTGGPATAPTQGTGMWIVPANTIDTVNVASHTVTVYGTTGDQFSIQAYTTGGAPVLDGYGQ